MKISIIAWDANFRESLHTIDFFAEQDLEKSKYEFLWVDYYHSNDHVREKVSQYPNTRLITLDNSSDRAWHLGQCINAGAAQAKGELLVIPDGDIAVEKDFLSKVLSNHKNLRELVTYHKRFDEPKEAACDISKKSIDYLKAYTELTNPTNYAGCLTLHRESFVSINGYETHPAFAGPGINGIELYIRLRNAGFLIKWDPKIRIYHPWHPSSGSAGHKEIEFLKKAKAMHPWVIPYAGQKQSWITHNREMSGETLASESRCEQILQKMPSLALNKEKILNKNRFSLGNIFLSSRKS